MKVLIGVDGSAGSFEAVRQVGMLLSAERDEIGLFCAPPGVRLDRHVDDEPALLQSARQAIADSVFQRAKEHLPQRLQDRVETIVGRQAARQGLVVAAETWRADMIAVGARGIGPVQKLLMGSVSTSVARSSKIPVFVARPRPADQEHDPWRILFAWHGSDTSEAAGVLLSRFAWSEETSGAAVHVVESLMAGNVPDWLQQQARDAESEAMAQAWVREHEDVKRTQLESLEAYCRKLAPPMNRFEVAVLEGHASVRLLEAIAERRANLVVVGAAGKSTLQRLLLGSTSATLLDQAPCSVLIVPQPQQP
jgi:nucleotide-binding universal stress UspA family protein